MRRRGLAPATQPDFSTRPSQQDLRDRSITDSSQQVKAMRGSKRVCQACGARFYDLLRDPIVCPSCGAHHVLEAPAGAAKAGLTDKTSWRGRRFKRPETESAPDPDLAPEVGASSQDAAEERAPDPTDDVVLDEELDEADIGLLDHHQAEPGER
jgi:uncharacterized protein (TIGR02300 family)